MSKAITAEQLRALQPMYAAYCRANQLDARDRHARLTWASVNVDRVLASFSDLTTAEASKLIDLLKTALGQEVIAPDRSKKKRRTRDEAQRAGTAGRRGSSNKDTTLVSAEDLARIVEVREALGWNQARLDAFLRSGSSPLKGRGAVRTQADANKVYWALKRILDRMKKRVNA